MLRITRLTDYAIVVLAALARGDGPSLTARELAAATNLPQPVVGKMLKRLTQAHLVVSQRGATGGYRLERDASSIGLAEVLEAVEGPFALTDCGEGEGDCEHTLHCALAPSWARVNGVVRRALASVTLKDMLVSEPRVLVPLRLGRHRGAALRAITQPSQNAQELKATS